MKMRPDLHLNKEFIVKIGIEIFSVVFAVLLALGLNEWRKNKSNHELVKDAYSNIKAEITRNHENLIPVLAEHDSLYNLLDSLVTRLKENDNDFDFAINELSFATLSNTAWETCKITNSIGYMDFKDVMEISDVYNVQKIYNALLDNFMDKVVFILNDKEKDENNQLYMIHLYLKYFSDVGQQLKLEYEESLEYLGKKENKEIES